MKNALLLLALAGALAPFSAPAQMADRQYPAPAIYQAPATPAELTRLMCSRLHLNEAQYLKLLPVNRIKMTRLNAINRQYKNDAVTRTAKITELEAYYDQECGRILTPSQLSQLQQQQSQPATAPAPSGNGLG
jgi:hypothetical protein